MTRITQVLCHAVAITRRYEFYLAVAVILLAIAAMFYKLGQDQYARNELGCAGIEGSVFIQQGGLGVCYVPDASGSSYVNGRRMSAVHIVQ